MSDEEYWKAKAEGLERQKKEENKYTIIAICVIGGVLLLGVSGHATLGAILGLVLAAAINNWPKKRYETPSEYIQRRVKERNQEHRD